LKLFVEIDAKEIHLGLEATAVYSWHPAMYFHEDKALQERNANVFTINPKLIKKFKEAYVDLDKPIVLTPESLPIACDLVDCQ
jgi:transposase